MVLDILPEPTAVVPSLTPLAVELAPTPDLPDDLDAQRALYPQGPPQPIRVVHNGRTYGSWSHRTTPQALLRRATRTVGPEALTRRAQRRLARKMKNIVMEVIAKCEAQVDQKEKATEQVGGPAIDQPAPPPPAYQPLPHNQLPVFLGHVPVEAAPGAPATRRNYTAYTTALERATRDHLRLRERIEKQRKDWRAWRTAMQAWSAPGGGSERGEPEPPRPVAVDPLLETDRIALDRFDADTKHFGPVLDVSRLERYDTAVHRYERALAQWERETHPRGPRPVPPPSEIHDVLLRHPQEACFVPRDTRPKNHPRDELEIYFYMDYRANQVSVKRPFHTKCAPVVRPYSVWRKSKVSKEEMAQQTRLTDHRFIAPPTADAPPPPPPTVDPTGPATDIVPITTSPPPAPRHTPEEQATWKARTDFESWESVRRHNDARRLALVQARLSTLRGWVQSHTGLKSIYATNTVLRERLKGSGTSEKGVFYTDTEMGDQTASAEAMLRVMEAAQADPAIRAAWPDCVTRFQQAQTEHREVDTEVRTQTRAYFQAHLHVSQLLRVVPSPSQPHTPTTEVTIPDLTPSGRLPNLLRPGEPRPPLPDENDPEVVGSRQQLHEESSRWMGMPFRPTANEPPKKKKTKRTPAEEEESTATQEEEDLDEIWEFGDLHSGDDEEEVEDPNAASSSNRRQRPTQQRRPNPKHRPHRRPNPNPDLDADDLEFMETDVLAHVQEDNLHQCVFFLLVST